MFMQSKKERNMKVYDICNANYEAVPMIRMTGKWLQAYGFEPGTPIKVECKKGKLIISVADQG